jgi:hypothetical protein
VGYIVRVRDLEVSPEAQVELLRSRLREINIKHLSAMEVNGKIEKEEEEQGFTIKMSLLLHSQFKEFRRRLGTASHQSKFLTQLALTFSVVWKTLKQTKTPIIATWRFITQTGRNLKPNFTSFIIKRPQYVQHML